MFCTNCGRVILVTIFKGTDFCSVNCRKDYSKLVELAHQGLCLYKAVWTDEVGSIFVCQVHNSNSQHELDPVIYAPTTTPCLVLDPYDHDTDI